jgi:hypothetical protein
MTCHSLPTTATSTMQNSMYQWKSCSAVKAFETQSFRTKVYTVRKIERVPPIANCSKLRNHRSLLLRSLQARECTRACCVKASFLAHHREQVQ